MKKEITKELLQKLYIDDGMSGLEVAKHLGISRTQFGRYVQRFSIPRKTLSEIMTGRKLSPSHRAKVIKTLSHKKGKDSPSWKGGRFVNSNGYIMLMVGDKYVKEHRYILGKHLGRDLLRTEHIHHIDGDKSNNALSNLLLVSNGEHMRIHHQDKEFVENISRKMKAARRSRFWSTRKRI